MRPRLFIGLSIALTAYLSVSACYAAVGTSGVETWYVRPAEACANNGDGLSYSCAASAGATGAFRTFSNVIWTSTTGVDDGDTLYICGAHNQSALTVNSSAAGSQGAPIAIDFRCPGDPGSIRSTTLMSEALVPGNWTEESPGLWYLSTAAYSSYHQPRRALYNGRELFPASAKAALGTYEGGGAPLAEIWYDTAARRIYLNHTGNPANSLTTFETLVATGGGCVYAALCFVADANDFFEVINPRLEGGHLGSLFIAGADNITVYGTTDDNQSCVMGGFAPRGVLISDVGTTGNGNVASNITIRHCTVDAAVPNNFKRYTWQWTGNIGFPSQFGDGIGIYYGVAGAVIESNTVRDWGHTGIDITATAGAGTVTGVLVRRNTISGYNIEYGRAMGIAGAATGRATGNWLVSNRVMGHPIRSQINGNGNYVVGNVFVDHRRGTVNPTASQSMDFEGSTGIVSHDNVIANNTFINNPYAPCLSFRNGANTKSGYLVYNNLLVNCGGPEGAGAGESNVALWMADHASVGSNTFRNNAIFSTNRTDTVYYKATGQTTVAGFQAACSGDVCTDNLATDPQVTDERYPSTSGASPVRRAGIWWGNECADSRGRPCWIPPDIGAYQATSRDHATDRTAAVPRLSP